MSRMVTAVMARDLLRFPIIVDGKRVLAIWAQRQKRRGDALVATVGCKGSAVRAAAGRMAVGSKSVVATHEDGNVSGFGLSPRRRRSGPMSRRISPPWAQPRPGRPRLEIRPTRSLDRRSN